MECHEEKFEHFQHILLFKSSIEGRKQRRRPEIFALCMGTMPLERAQQDHGKKMVFLFFAISDTPCSGRLSGFDEDRLNALIHNDPHQCT